MQRWYVQQRRKLLGPLTKSDIIQEIKNHRILSKDWICLEGESEWRPCMEISEFAAEFSGEQMDLAQQYEAEEQWVVLVEKNNEENKSFEQSGPFSTRELISLLYKGEVEYSDRVWKPGFESWKCIGLIEDFIPTKVLESNSKLVDEKTIYEPINLNAIKSLPLENKEISIEEIPTETDGLDLVKVGKIDRSNEQIAFPDESLGSYEPSHHEKERLLKSLSINKDSLRQLALFVASALIVLILGSFVWSKLQFSINKSEANSSIESENQKKFLRIEAFALTSLSPKLKFISNADRDDKIHLSVRARSGQVLGVFHFEKELELDYSKDKTAELALANFKLPKGLYTFEASLGELKAQREYFVGLDDAVFQKELKNFRQTTWKRQELEKKILTSLSDELIVRAKELNIAYKKSKAKRTEWNNFYNQWKRKFYKTAHTELRRFSQTTETDYYYSDTFRDLKLARIDLWKMAKDMNDAVESKKNKLATNKVQDLERSFFKIKSYQYENE